MNQDKSIQFLSLPQNRECFIKQQYDSIEQQNKEEILKYINSQIVNDKLNIIIDSSIYQFDIQNTKNLKFNAFLPNNITDQIIITNPFVDLSHLDDANFIDVQQYSLPIAQTVFLDDYDSEKAIERQIFEYIVNNIYEEKDILIYCSNLMQMDNLNESLTNIGNVEICINEEFDELYKEIFQNKNQSKSKHKIYLALEAQYIPNNEITLIIQTHQKEIVLNYQNYSIEQQTVNLSQTELAIRLIPRSRKEPVKIIYAFSEATYLSLPIKPIQYNYEFPKMPYADQKLAIIFAVLQTPGNLLLNDTNIYLIARTSPFWSKSGDAFSWINIIMALNQKIQQILDTGSQQHIMELENWCKQHLINVLKGILVILKINDISNQLDSQEIKLLIRDMQLPSLKKQASSFQERFDERSLEIQLKECFPHITKDANKSYLLKEKKFEVARTCSAKLLGHVSSDALLLGLIDGKVQFINNIVNRKASSSGMKEFVIPNVGNAIMNELWKNDGYEITKIEEQNNCSIEPNLELNIISIFSENEEAQKNLEILIEQIQQIIGVKTKEIPFYEDRAIVIGNGGLVQEIKGGIEQVYQFQAINFPLDTTEDDIRELFEDYTTILGIKRQVNKNEARFDITIEDGDDLRYIWKEFDELEYEGREIRIITNVQIAKQKNKYMQNFKLKVFWYTKVSKGTCTIQFYNQQQLQEAYQILNNQRVDGNTIKLKIIDNLTLQINNIHQYTTEYDIIRFCGGYQAIQGIIFDASQLPETNFNIGDKLLQMMRHRGDHKVAKGIELKSLKRKGNGQRMATFIVPNPGVLQELLESINNELIPYGFKMIKIHAQASFKETFKIPIILKQELQETLQKCNVDHTLKFKDINQVEEENLWNYLKLVVECHSNVSLNRISQIVNEILKGKKIELAKNMDVIFSNVGLLQLKELEKKFENVQFLPNPVNRVLRAYCPNWEIQMLQEELESFIQKNSTFQIQLPPKIMKHLIGVDGQGLKKFQEQFNLSNIKFSQITKQIQLEGSVADLDQASSALQNTIHQFYQQQPSEEYSPQTCGFCFDNIQNAYLLQSCGHKFCLECIIFQLTNNMNDVNSLPIRCPECNKNLILDDILNLIGDINFEKLQSISINKFVQDNLKTYTFCYTKDCPNILTLGVTTTSHCRVCSKTFCLDCKTQAHPGMTCEENRIGDYGLLLKLMEKEDIRKCPNCKSLAQHVSGCYRVQCRACQKHICWKKKSDGTPCMVFYDKSQDCYDHLTKVHGGYF